MVKKKNNPLFVFILILVVLFFLLKQSSSKQVDVSYNYYDESGNLLGSGRESTVNGIPGVYYVRVVTNVKNTGTVPLRNIGVSSASPAAVASAYSGVADVATLGAGATTTLTSGLINITQFEGTVPVSIVIDSQYTTGDGVNSTVTYTGNTNLVVTPDTTPITGKIYYVSMSTGSDSNTGLTESAPIKTIAKVNTIALKPGDSVLFKKGDMWRFPTDAYLSVKSGNSSSYLTYGAYGIGSKPLFLGSVTKNTVADWSNIGTNLWRSTDISTYNKQAGQLIFNNEASVGYKKENMSILVNQGDFWYDSSTDTVVLYSTLNPASQYTNIEIAIAKPIIQASSNSYIVLENTDMRYTAAGAFEAGELGIAHHLNIVGNSVSYWGGQYQSGTLRSGNGIGFSLTTNNIYVAHNTVGNGWDACISPQAWLTAGVKSIINHTYEYNVMYNCPYGFEYFNSDTSSHTNNFLVQHNTILNTGYGWVKEQKGNTGRCFRLARTPYDTTNFKVINNLCVNSSTYSLDLASVAGQWRGQINMSNNLYWDTKSFIWDGKTYTTLSAFRNAVSTQESDSLSVNPNLDSNYKPSGAACTMSSTGGYVGAVPC